MATTSNLSPKVLRPPSSQTHPVWPMGLILAIAAILRFIQLGTEGVWLDEMYSLDDAINLSSDNLDLRPLYYLLLRLWMIVGKSDATLRMLSVLLDLGAIYLAYRLCKFTLGYSAALITALMMSLSPLMINHAQEIRMYALLSCLTLGGSLAMAYALETPKFKYLGLWAWARLMAILTSPLMLIMLIPDAVLYGLTYRNHQSKLRQFLYYLGFTIAVWSALILPNFLGTVSRVVEDQTAHFDIGLTNLLSRLVQFTVFWPLNSGELLKDSLLPIDFYKVFAVILLMTLAIGIGTSLLNLQSRATWIAAWAFLPLIVQYLACEILLSGTIWKPRYLLYLAPYIIMLLALGFARIRAWLPWMSVVLALIYFVAVGGGLQFYYSQNYRTPWPAIADTIETLEHPDDLIVNYTWMGNHNFPRYYEGNAKLITIHLPRRQSIDERLQQVTAAAQKIPQAERLWVICQAECKDKESVEFDLITQSAVKGDLQIGLHEHFSNIVHEDTGWGTVDLYLITRRE